MKIMFDMDGTIANLYGVENWLEMLHNYDETPYKNAEVMLNMSLLARYLNIVQKLGFEIGIISWLSKNGNMEYNEKVTLAKIEWLNKHLASVNFDYIHIVSYGTPKSFYTENCEDILFDDEEYNRNEWTGTAYTPDKIIEVLKGLAREGI